MRNITLLKPTWDKASTAKLYKKDAKGKPEKVNDYKLGKTFLYGTATVKNIQDIYNLLDKVKDQNVFRIYGQPVEGLEKPCARKKENFVCKSTNLLLIDADGWPVPKGYSISTPAELQKTIQHITVDLMGFKFLENVAFCCLLSSSAWSKTDIRAHIYYMIDKPVDLVVLSNLAKEHNKVEDIYRIDASLFRQVQPDYISKRKCIDFVDPLPDGLRLNTHCDDETIPYISKAGLVEHFLKLSNQPEPINQLATTGSSDPYATNTLVNPTQELQTIGSNWFESLKLCGTDMGINEPAYRACAQLVKREGPTTCKDNIHVLSKRVHTEMWKCIETNARNGKCKGRDLEADRKMYNAEKLKGYILDAANKQYGGEIDALIVPVTALLDSIKTGQVDASELLDVSIVEKLSLIKKHHHKQWVKIEARIKGEARGKIAIGDLRSAIEQKLGAQDIIESSTEIIKSYKWIEDISDQNLYCKLEENGMYTLKSMDNMSDAIMVEAFNRFSGKVPKDFVKYVLSTVRINKNDPATNVIEEAVVETRTHTQVGECSYLLTYNLGKISEYDMKTLKVDSKGVNIVNSLDDNVLWKDIESTQTVDVADYSEELDLFGEVGKELYIDSYLDKFGQLTSLEETQDIADAVAWMVNAVVCHGTAKLLEIVGPSGSGKSTTATMLKEFIDPTTDSIRTAKRRHSTIYKDKELVKVLKNDHVTVFDNLSNLTNAEQNKLCVIATGFEHSQKILYSNLMANTVIIRPIILTALDNVVTNDDLTSRTITVKASPDAKGKCRNIFVFWERHIAEMRLGFFLLVSRTLQALEDAEKKGKDVMGRDIVTDTVKKIIYPKLGLIRKGATEVELEAMVQEDKIIARNGVALDKDDVAAMVMFILTHPRLQGRKDLELIKSFDFYKDYSDFVFENIGQLIEHPRCSAGISNKARFEDQRYFNKIMLFNKKPIEDITGWRFGKKRYAGGMTWRFEWKDN